MSQSNNNSYAETICAWHGCPRKTQQQQHNTTTPPTMLKCSRCMEVPYCSKQCQKSAWVVHKWTCVSPDVPRHTLSGTTTTTLSAIQAIIDRANPGDIIELTEGTYGSNNSNDDTLTISKPVHLIGAGMDKVTIIGNVHFRDSVNAQTTTSGNANHISGTLVVANLKIKGIVTIQNTRYEIITFLSVEVNCPPAKASNDALTIQNCKTKPNSKKSKILLLCCEIVGGSDGVMITDAPDVHLLDVDISLARNRGIFANDYFIIEDSTIYSCGGYGIKGRAGWEEKGNDNEIQPGPWNSFGGGMSMFGGF